MATVCDRRISPLGMRTYRKCQALAYGLVLWPERPENFMGISVQDCDNIVKDCHAAFQPNSARQCQGTPIPRLATLPGDIRHLHDEPFATRP